MNGECIDQSLTIIPCGGQIQIRRILIPRYVVPQLMSERKTPPSRVESSVHHGDSAPFQRDIDTLCVTVLNRRNKREYTERVAHTQEVQEGSLIGINPSAYSGSEFGGRYVGVGKANRPEGLGRPERLELDQQRDVGCKVLDDQIKIRRCRREL